MCSALKLIFVGVVVLGAATFAQQKRIPPPGIPVPADVRTRLEGRLRRFQEEINETARWLKEENSLQYFADIRIYEKAVRYALEHNEFFRANEFVIAERLLEDGRKRLAEIEHSRMPWLNATGLVVRGYVSRIDRSVQPFGLVVPASYRPGDGKRYRLDIWLHGRDETLTELKFMHERSTRRGEFTPPETFVLHPYGRYCNAFKFAGETDVFEALEAVQRDYPIDPARVALRGFSMGGAGVWHLATHHADQWVCAAPGAGFAETAEYLRLKRETVPKYEQALWQWYDARDYALNLFHCPTIAYSGELDKQRQAADVMEAALRVEGLPLVHLIGAKTEHKYQPETKRMLETLVDAIAEKGRDLEPGEIRFTTRTLQYPKMHWITLLGLEKHWVRADVRATLGSNRVSLTLTNVRSFMLDLKPETERRLREVEVNGQKITNLVKAPNTAYLVFTNASGRWSAGGSQAEIFTTMTKGMGHQGPIDDAFSSGFVLVAPEGAGFHSATTDWINREFQRAVFEWRAQFRGDAPMVRASDLTNFVANHHVVLWGDPHSNGVLRRIMSQLPIKWTENKIEFGGETYDARQHVPLLIFPNPLNPERYVVLNSGFTFRRFGSNADQTAKLPDYAILDTSKEDPFASAVKAGFFNEHWQLE